MLVSLVMCSFSMTSEAADDGSGTGETVDPGNVVTYTYSKTVNNVTTEYTMNYIIDTESMTADVYGFPENVDKSVTKIRIPGTITVDEKEYVVMDIASNAFKDNDWLKTVTIEDNGSSDKRVVGENAFANASALYLLNYPVNSVGGGFVSIGDGAFSGTALTSPNFQKIAFIGTDAFKDCTKLTNANINNVTEIGDGAFSGCTSLKTVNAKVLTKAGANAFSGCTALKTVNAQELTNVGVGVFSGCTALTDVSLGECDSVLELFKDSAKLEYITIAGVYHPIVNGSIGEYDDTNSLFKIGSNYYPTLATALSNLDNGEKLMLLKNLEVSSVSIENVDDFIFDLGGKTLTLTSYDGLSLLNSTGVLQNGDVVSTFNGKSEKEEAVAIRLTVLCELTVSGVDVVIQSTSKDATWNNSGFVLESQSKLTMENGSTITSSNLSETDYGSIGVVVLGPGSEKDEVTGREVDPTELIINKGVSITVGQYGISGNGSIIMEDDSGDDTGSGEQGTGVATQDEGGDPASVKKDFRNTSITISGATVSAKYGWGIYHPQIGKLVIKDGAIISGVTGIEMRSGSLTIDGATITAAKEYSLNTESKASSVSGAAIAVAPYRSADELGIVTVNIVDGSFEGGVAFAQSNPGDVTDPGFDFSVSGGIFTSTGTRSSTGETYPAIVAEEKEAAGKFVTGGTFKSGDTADNTVVDYVDDNYELDPNGSGTVDIVDTNNAVAVVDGKYLATIDEVIKYAAINDGCTVKFLNDVTLSTPWVISNTVTIDLNDCTITNGVSSGSMILVEDGASLTIKDEGTDETKVGTISDSYANKTILAEKDSTVVIKSGYFYKKADSGAILEASGSLTVKGGYFIFETGLDNADGYAIRVTYGGDAVIEDVTIQSQKAGILVRGYSDEDSSTTLTVNNATINSSYYAFAVWGYGYTDDSDNDNVVLTVKNADVTVKNENQLNNSESAAFGTCANGGTYAGHTINIEGGTYTSNTGCYFPSYGKYNISGGIFNSSMYGIRICAGELTISGSASIKVNADGTATSLVPEDNDTDKPTGTMGPLTIGKQTSTGYPGDIVVNIKGGTLTNNTDGGNAITVYDYNLASETYNDQTISVTVSGGTVTGDVEYVHTDDIESDSKDVSYEMTGGTVDGNIVADASIPSENITITSGVITGTVDDSFLGEGMIIDDSGEVVPDPNAVFDITAENFFNLADKETDGTLVFNLDRNYRITDYSSRVYFNSLSDQSYSSIVINGNGHTIYANLIFDAYLGDGDSESYSIVIYELNIDGIYGENGWSYGISIQNQSPAKDIPRLIDFTMIGGSISNCDAKGIYITTAKSVTISGVDISNCATASNYNGSYYTKGDYAVDIDITGIDGAEINISGVTFSGSTGAIAALKIAQRGGAGDNSDTWGEATINGVTLSGLDFSNSQAPTDIMIGSEPNTPSSDPSEDETRDYNSAFPVDLTANGETSLSVWGADRQPSNGHNLRLDLTDGSRVSTTGQKNDENGEISIRLVSGSVKISGQLLPNMHFIADEGAVTFGEFEDLSGGNLELIQSEPDHPFIPGDDDDEYVPPIYVPSDTSSSDDDTVKIVACAAAAVVAAMMAAFLILGHRRE